MKQGKNECLSLCDDADERRGLRVDRPVLFVKFLELCAFCGLAVALQNHTTLCGTNYQHAIVPFFGATISHGGDFVSTFFNLWVILDKASIGAIEGLRRQKQQSEGRMIGTPTLESEKL